MGNMITRKCACCKGEIAIDKNNLNNILFFNKLYYHTKCFEEMAVKKAASKRGKPQMWQDALDRLWEIEAETKKMLESYLAKDELNMWLLEHYDVIEVPTRLFQIIAELELGKYKGKRCKPVKASTLCGCWKWGQHKLDEIDQYNKTHNKGPSDDSARIMYDLAVLIGKVPNYLAYKEKQKAARNEMVRTAIMYDDIDMSKIRQGKQTKRKDISDISNDIFTE
jgi:hypothetical protein